MQLRHNTIYCPLIDRENDNGRRGRKACREWGRTDNDISGTAINTDDSFSSSSSASLSHRCHVDVGDVVAFWLDVFCFAILLQSGHSYTSQNKWEGRIQRAAASVLIKYFLFGKRPISTHNASLEFFFKMLKILPWIRREYYILLSYYFIFNWLQS